jgi:KDO2-lipid IV(A) lauroyltransferase
MKNPAFEWRFLLPAFWPVWIGIAFIFLLALLPWFVQKRLGDLIGWLSWQLVGQRRKDTLVNLRLCFPEKTEAEREQIARGVFRYTGRGIFETANAWFIPLEFYRRKIHFEGLELLQAAKAEGRGVLLLGAHYTSLDFGGALCSLYIPIDTVFRPQNNKLFEYMARRQRDRVYDWQIDHDNMRGLIKALRQGHVVWYTPDQDYGLRQGVFAPFFGVEAATITATARLARVNHSVVMFVHFYLREDGGINMSFFPGPENYPSGDDVADASRVNQQLEFMIRRAPEQYMWYHRRFKTRPPGEPVPYVKKRRQIREEKELAAKAAAGKES